MLDPKDDEETEDEEYDELTDGTEEEVEGRTIEWLDEETDDE